MIGHVRRQTAGVMPGTAATVLAATVLAVTVLAVTVLAATVLAGMAGVATARADPDPTSTPDAAVPTAEQVAGLLSRLTDSATPGPAKVALVRGGLSPDELSRLDEQVNQLNRAGCLPFAIDVSDIQPAPNNYVGVTVSITGKHIPIPF